MGYSLAKMESLMGASVTLISTKRNLKVPINVENIIYVDSANQMYEKTMDLSSNMDIVIMSAAVSDFRVKNIRNEKIKKADISELKLELELNQDILMSLSKIENKKFTLVGFAAETNNIDVNARKKLEKKNLDYLILNDVSDKTIGFNSDYNEVYIYTKNGDVEKIEKNTKDNIAKNILEKINERS